MKRSPFAPTAIKIARIAIGVAFLILGVLGLFLPILQGILFLAIGISILSIDWPPARRLRDRVMRRFPGLASGVHAWSRRLASWTRGKARAARERVRASRRGRAPAAPDPPEEGG